MAQRQSIYSAAMNGQGQHKRLVYARFLRSTGDCDIRIWSDLAFH